MLRQVFFDPLVDTVIDFFIRSVNVNNQLVVNKFLDNKSCHVNADDVGLGYYMSKRRNLIIDVKIFCPIQCFQTMDDLLFSITEGLVVGDSPTVILPILQAQIYTVSLMANLFPDIELDANPSPEVEVKSG